MHEFGYNKSFSNKSCNILIMDLATNQLYLLYVFARVEHHQKKIDIQKEYQCYI